MRPLRLFRLRLFQWRRDQFHPYLFHGRIRIIPDRRGPGRLPDELLASHHHRWIFRMRRCRAGGLRRAGHSENSDHTALIGGAVGGRAANVECRQVYRLRFQFNPDVFALQTIEFFHRVCFRDAFLEADAAGLYGWPDDRSFARGPVAVPDLQATAIRYVDVDGRVGRMIVDARLLMRIVVDADDAHPGIFQFGNGVTGGEQKQEQESFHSITLNFSLRAPYIPALRGTLLLIALTALCHWLHLTLVVSSPLFFVAIVLNSLEGGLFSAAAVCVVAVLLQDYFFTEPLFSLTVSDPQDLLALFAFGTSSFVVTILAGKARREAAEANLRRQNLQQLYLLSQWLLELPPGAVSIPDACVAVLRATSVCVFDGESKTLYGAGAEDLSLEAQTRACFESAQAACDGRIRILETARERMGAIGFAGLSDSAQLLDGVATLVTGILDRSRHARIGVLASARAEAETMRGAILDALAHEFKTPLATILTSADGLLESLPLTEPQMHLAGLIGSEASRLAALTKRLLRIARLDAEEIRPHLDDVDLPRLVSGLLARISRQFPQTKFQMECSPEELEVVADAELIQLALGQLLENAAKYGTRGEPVVVAVQSRGIGCQVSVWSAGHAIGVEQQHRIFDRFQNSSGTGLGLYVARKIARAHGGELHLETPESGGNRFILSLPEESTS